MEVPPREACPDRNAVADSDMDHDRLRVARQTPRLITA
jgi:hypothetical protein